MLAAPKLNKYTCQVDGQEEEKTITGRQQKEKLSPGKKDMDKYKGYELLLTAEDDSSYTPPKGSSLRLNVLV